MSLNGAASIWFRTLVSALVVGCITTGSGLQTVLQDGKMPSRTQLYSAIGLGVLALLNDVKSRLTPPGG